MLFTEQDLTYMQFVINKTKEGMEKGNWPFGACIANGERAVSVAHNVCVATHDPTAHAEINAIRQACAQLMTTDLSDHVIYTSSAPCPMCFAAIYWSGIKRIVYGLLPEDYSILGVTGVIILPEKLAEIGQLDIKIEGGLMKTENQALIALYYRKY